MRFGKCSYRKHSKICTPKTDYRNCPKIEQFSFRMYNASKRRRWNGYQCRPRSDCSLEEQSDLGRHCLLSAIWPNTLNHYGVSDAFIGSYCRSAFVFMYL